MSSAGAVESYGLVDTVTVADKPRAVLLEPFSCLCLARSFCPSMILISYRYSVQA